MRRVVLLLAIAVLVAGSAAACGKTLRASDVVGTYRVFDTEGSGSFLQFTLTPAGQWKVTDHEAGKPAGQFLSGRYRLDGHRILFSCSGRPSHVVGHLAGQDLVLIYGDGGRSTWIRQ